MRSRTRNWRPGVIVRIHQPGPTFDVAYADGKLERGISIGCIKPFPTPAFSRPSGSPFPATEVDIAVGAQVVGMKSCLCAMFEQHFSTSVAV